MSLFAGPACSLFGYFTRLAVMSKVRSPSPTVKFQYKGKVSGGRDQVQDLATLKGLMGHSHITITMRYVHPTPEHKQEAMRKLERFNAEQTSVRREAARRVPSKVPTEISRRLQRGAKLLKRW